MKLLFPFLNLILISSSSFAAVVEIQGVTANMNIETCPSYVSASNSYNMLLKIEEGLTQKQASPDAIENVKRIRQGVLNQMVSLGGTPVALVNVAIQSPSVVLKELDLKVEDQTIWLSDLGITTGGNTGDVINLGSSAEKNIQIAFSMAGFCNYLPAKNSAEGLPTYNQSELMLASEKAIDAAMY